MALPTDTSGSTHTGLQSDSSFIPSSILSSAHPTSDSAVSSPSSAAAAHRQLDFIGIENSTGERILFVLFSVIVAGVFVRCVYQTYFGSNVPKSSVIRYVFPFALLVMFGDNILMALGKKIEEDSIPANVIFIVHPSVIPAMLMMTFELTYIVHKVRSCNFCGLSFSEGHRVTSLSWRETMGFRSWLLRNFVGIISVTLTVCGCIVNFDLVKDGATEDEKIVGGWGEIFDDDGGHELLLQMHSLLTLLPISILVLSNIYFAFCMCLYGANSSIILHSSYCNPWISNLLGTVALGAGQFGKDDFFRVTSNLGEVIMVLMIMLMMNEVNKDVHAASEFTDFLDIIDDKIYDRDEESAEEGDPKRVKTVVFKVKDSSSPDETALAIKPSDVEIRL